MAKQPKQKRVADDDPEVLEKIVEQFTNRLRDGEHPAIAEYQEQYPQFKDEIEDLLASVAMIEQLKSDPTQPATARRSFDEVSSLTQIGSYKIVGELGRGGMGVVFEAVHQSLGRRVAIKVMPTPLVNSEKYVKRFKREAKAAARLHHTNIVGVFGVGEGEGYYYYVMDFVDGQSLSEIVFGLNHGKSSGATQINDETRHDSQPSKGSTDADGLTVADIGLSDSQSFLTNALPKKEPDIPKPSENHSSPKHFRWAARIGANVADALAYAHDARILHRDIKPANIILDRKGVVWITDFGLAKDSTNEINLTKTGDVIGTPQYLAPESLQGDYDQRSEVYCLGLTIYELASLQPAYKSGTTAEVIGAIASSSPPPLKKINPRIPIDLSTIVDKAVSRDPNARYQTAKELQQDLLAFVEDRPISARPLSTIENVVKWSRRNPLAAALSAVSVLLLMMVAVAASVGYLYTIDALAKLQTEQRNTIIEKKNAEDFAEKMQAQYNRAEGNIAITIQAFDEMFKQVVSRGSASNGDIDLDGFEELSGIETSITAEDAAFLDKLLVFYDQFAKQNADNDALRKESARAFRRVANIYQLIGDPNRAIDAYTNSIEAYEQVRQQSPDAKDVLIALVNTKTELSSLYRRNANLQEALEQTDSAISLLREVPVDQLDDELKLELAKTLNSLGSSSTLIAAFEKDRPGMLEQYLRERAKRGNFSGGRIGPEGGRRPPNREGFGGWGPERGGGPEGRGQDHRRPGMGGASRILDWRSSNYSSEAIEILDDLINRNPDNSVYHSVRANCYCSLAAAELKPNAAKARKMRDRAIEELEALIQSDPENFEYQFRLALACSLGGIDDTSQSEMKLMEKSVKIAQSLKEKFPQFLDYYYLDCSVHIKYAGRLLKSKQYEKAFDSLKAAHESFEHVDSFSPTDRTYQSTRMSLAEQLTKFAPEAEKAGKSSLARDARNMRSKLRKPGGHRTRGR